MKASKVQNFLFFLFLFFLRFGHTSELDCRGILAAFVGEMHKPLVDPRVSYQEPTNFLKEIFESKGTHYSESEIKKKVEAEFADADPMKQKISDEIDERIDQSQQQLKAAEKRKQTPQLEGGQDASP